MGGNGGGERDEKKKVGYQTLHRDCPGPEPPCPYIEHSGVIRRHDGNNVYLCLDSEVKSALFERPQLRSGRVAPRTLGENEDILAFPLHLGGGALERF